MKNRISFLFFLASFILCMQSCGEEENFHQIAPVEREVYLKINQYRTTNGLNSLVEQFLLFKEARMVAEKIAANDYELNDPEAEQDLGELADNLGGTSHALLTFPIEEKDASLIMNYLKASAEYSELLLGEYTQCGVGISTDNEGKHYAVIMLVQIPDII
ncbi:MAG: CAP domain-containing protein [Bacteroidota bacterium]